MDDFVTGPKSFDLWFFSSDETTSKNNDGSYTFRLKKPLEFADEWEIGIKQVLIKSPFNSSMYNMTYKDTKQNDTKILNFSNIGIPSSSSELINSINSNIPDNFKQFLSFDVQEDGHVTIHVKDTQIQFQNDYMAKSLGFIKGKNYPPQKTDMISQIRAQSKPNILLPIFLIRCDITLSDFEILIIDIFTDTGNYVNYKYEKVSYYNILRNYISAINITLQDLNHQNFNIESPFLIKFNLRRSQI